MDAPKKYEVDKDAWTSLQSFTPARIALGRAGVAIPLKENLAFKLAHAHARDAVYASLDTGNLLPALQSFQLPVYLLHSNARSRSMYLQRPDYGRKLHGSSVEQLKLHIEEKYDVAIVLADGLSAHAINTNAVAVLKSLIQLLRVSKFSIAPITMVEQGRVAVADEIGHQLHAKLVVILIGERPGLSAVDSIGAYITYKPRPGLTDEARNCISNIRPGGLDPAQAAFKIHKMIAAALQQQLTGIRLKEDDALGMNNEQ